MYAMNDKQGKIYLFPIDQIARRLKEGYHLVCEVNFKELNYVAVKEGRTIDDFLRVQKELFNKIMKELDRRSAIIKKLEGIKKDFKNRGFK